MLDTYLQQTFALLLMHIMALMVPGADFAMTLKQTTQHGRRAGMATAFGITAGLLVHLSYALLGVSYLLQSSPEWVQVIRVLGASYLFYLGWQMWRSPPQASSKTLSTDASNTQAFRQGLITNVFNPKPALFFLSLFSQVIDPQTPWYMLTLDVVALCGSTWLWFACVALILSQPRWQQSWQQHQAMGQRILGSVFMLLALGLWLA
jgi:RhtB (resistance to homoserine/threonine) family protein